MSIIAQRATFLAAGGMAAALAAVPAQAQADRNAVLNVLVECAKIDDPTARLACYDNNIRNAGGVVRRTIPGQVRVQGGGAPIAGNEGPAGFGRENIRTEERFSAPAGQLQSIRPKVTAILPREPGKYLLTLEDGAQWVFAQSVRNDYRLPVVGSIVEIERGAMGSFLMRFDGQGPVQVIRVK
jgi:hypothetical protein